MTELRINHIEDSGPLVNVGHLPDLDMLMLDVLAWCAAEEDDGGEALYWGGDRYEFEHDGRTLSVGGDRSTSIPGSYDREAEVGWFRKNPCSCGDEHAFDMDSLGTTPDGDKPTVKAVRGAFLGVHFG